MSTEDQEYREGINRGKEEVKNQRMEELLNIIRDRNSLSGFTTFEIMQLVQNYSELVYLEEEQLIISPAYSSTCKFLIISGKVAVYEDNEENDTAISKHFLKKKMLRNEFNTRGEVHSVDKHILKQYDQKIEDDLLVDIDAKEELTVGSWFGSTAQEQNDNFVISKSFVELLMINQTKLDKLRKDNYYLYQKFTRIFQVDLKLVERAAEKLAFLALPQKPDDQTDHASMRSGNSKNTMTDSLVNRPIVESNLKVLDSIKKLLTKLN